ncbi:MAG: universal stress protein [Pseudomonadota bacterium]
MQFKRIIATIDVSDDLAEKVLKVARSLAERDGATLEAVCVWPPPATSAMGAGADGGASAAVASQAILEQHSVGRTACSDTLDTLVKKIAPGAKTVMLDGDPADSAADYAKETNADLIVTGSHQRGFWGALVHGSASRNVIHDAPCAVFVVTKAFAAKV